MIFHHFYRCLQNKIIPFLLIVLLLSCISLSSLAQAPVITAFTPSPVCQGETVTISGVNFSGATAVKAGTMDAASFKVNNDTIITAVVSSQSSTGTIGVITPKGTGISTGNLTILLAPMPSLNDVSTIDIPFTNCNGNATYQITVSNTSKQIVGLTAYDIDWGDGSAHFMQADWQAGGTTSHTYNNQGYFNIKLTVTPPNGCAKSIVYSFYNGSNPLASLSTDTSTTGMCADTTVNFIIGGKWYSNSAGTKYQLDFGDGSPSVTLQQPLNISNADQLLPHKYTTSSCPNIDFKATLKVFNGCITTTYTQDQIVVRIKPAADFAVPVIPTCVNSPICFTNATKDGFSGTSCNRTSNLTWDFGDGSQPSSETNPCHTYANSGTYTVALTSSNSSCGGDTKTKTIVVLPLSPPPAVSATPLNYCQGQTAAPLTATGTALLWYSSSTDGTGSLAAPVPSTTTPGTRIYYVSQTIPGNCESPRVPISVIVNATPLAPIVNSPVQLCKDAAANPLSATGDNLLWYTTSSGGTGSTTAPTPSTSIVGNTTYYVSQATNNCEGPRASILVSVNSLAQAPVVTSPVVYCQNQQTSILTATGNNLLWYTSIAGGIGNASAPLPSSVIAGSTTYYVSQSTACGESERSAITVTVNESPSASIAYNTAILCNAASTATTPNPPADVILSGTKGGIYSISPSSGLPIDASTGTIIPAGATPQIYTIKYLITGTGGCANFVTTASVTVTGTPTAAIAYPAICASGTVANVTLSGTGGGIFSSAAGLVIDSLTGAITPGTSIPGTYTVTYTIQPSAPCPGFITMATVNVTKPPSASIAYNVSNLCNAISTASNPNPQIDVVLTGTNGGTYSISPGIGLPIDPVTGTITPSGATAQSYTITYTVLGTGGCSDFTATANVTVSATPQATLGYPSICTSDGAVDPQFIGTKGGRFTAPAGLSVDSITGRILPSTSVPGTYSVTYIILPSSPCPGFTTSVAVKITEAPSATMSYGSAFFCNVINTASIPNPSVAITLAGTQGGLYSISPSTGLSIDATTGTINPSGATAGTYIVKYSITGTGGCSDYETTTPVTVSNTPAAAIAYPGSPYCRGTTILQPVNFTGTAGGTFSAGADLSIDAATGAINPAQSKPGTYTITYTIAATSPCPGFITTTTIEIADSPVLSFAVSKQTVCSGQTAAFVPSSTVTNSVYTWSVSGQLPPDISGISSGTSSGANAVISLSFTNNGFIGQSIPIEVIATNPAQNPCAGSPYTITLVVNPVPAALSADTVNFCMHTPAIQLTVNGSQGNTVKWYDENGNYLNTAPVINPANTGKFIYQASQVNNYGCESQKSTIAAIVNPAAKIVSASYTNPTTCGTPSGSVVLGVLDLNNNAIPNTPVLVHYNKFQTAYAVQASTDASGNITIPLVAGTYSDIYTETFGCTSAKTPDVIVLKDPTPPAQPIAGYNPPLCSEATLNLSALSPASNTAGPVSYVWAGPAFGASADTIKNTVVSFPDVPVSAAGEYIVYAIQNNCISPATSFLVTILQSPTKPVIVTKTPLCVGADLMLQAYSTIPGDNTLNYTWTGPGSGFSVNGSLASISKVTVEDGGQYSVKVTSPQTACSTATDTIIEVGDYPIVKFAKDSLTLPAGYVFQLASDISNAANPNVLPIIKYEWSPAQNITCNDAACSAPATTVKNNACYQVKATNKYGCSGSASICITAFCERSQVFVPNAFTPRNGLPENAVLMVRASGISSVKSFRVFNRWGRLVFEKSNFSPNDPHSGWDGMLNGKLADTGVYVYTVEAICENGLIYTYKGNVTLL